MINNRTLGLSALTLSIIAATSNAQTFQATELQLTPVNANNTMTAVNADFTPVSYTHLTLPTTPYV